MPPLTLKYLPGVYKARQGPAPRTLQSEILLDYVVAALASGASGLEAAKRAIACYEAIEPAWGSLKSSEGKDVEVPAKRIIRVLATEVLATGAEGLTAAMRAKEAYRGIREKLRQFEPAKGE